MVTHPRAQCLLWAPWPAHRNVPTSSIEDVDHRQNTLEMAVFMTVGRVKICESTFQLKPASVLDDSIYADLADQTSFARNDSCCWYGRRFGMCHSWFAYSDHA